MLFNLDDETGELVSGNEIKYTKICLFKIPEKVGCNLRYHEIILSRNRLVNACMERMMINWGINWD
jgi:hypothetical protein